MYIVIQHSVPEPPTGFVLKINIYWMLTKYWILGRAQSLLQTPYGKGTVIILIV